MFALVVTQRLYLAEEGEGECSAGTDKHIAMDGILVLENRPTQKLRSRPTGCVYLLVQVAQRCVHVGLVHALILEIM